MGKVTLFAGALGLAVLALIAPTPLKAQALQRAVYASALDQNGAPIPDLGPKDFVVREDKVAREILGVEPSHDPMQIALLVDNSQAGEQFTRDYREALVTFIKTMAADESGAKHQYSIITLAERPTINTDYTFDAQQAIKGAERIFGLGGSGTYLLDGIIETSKNVIKKSLPHPVIIAITTEGLELSDRQYMTVLEPLHDSGAVLNVITVGSPRSNTNYDRSVVIDMGTRDTGGRNDTVMVGSALTGRLKQVAVELTHQYKVTYARPDTLIPPDQVSISAARPGLTVRGTATKVMKERP